MLFHRIAVAALLSVALAVPPAAAQTGDAARTAAVKQALSNDGVLRRLAVSVSGSQVMLSGNVPTLAVKMDAIKRALKVEGIETVLSEMELPKAESDLDLALFIGRAIDGYPHYTMFDYIDAVIRNGVVTLLGSVTPDGRKAEEIAGEVARVRGVQEIRNDIETLPPSQGDDNLRAAIFDRIASSNDFDRFADVRNPPFHIVVRNGAVTLFGRVQGEIEYRQLEQLVRFAPGVGRVENKLQTAGRQKR